MPSPHPHRRCVLLVDDDPDIREALSVGLGHVALVTTAANGEDALALLRSGAIRPDLILLDLMMPVLDGWAFLRAVAREPALASIPVVTMTAAAGLDGAACGHPCLRTHLTKPFPLAVVEELVLTSGESR